MPPQDNLIPVATAPVMSPLGPTKTMKKVTEADMEAIKELLGVECVFIVVDSNEHACDPDTCMGHNYSVRQSGFSQEQILGIMMGVAERMAMGATVPGDGDKEPEGEMIEPAE